MPRLKLSTDSEGQITTATLDETYVKEVEEELRRRLAPASWRFFAFMILATRFALGSFWYIKNSFDSLSGVLGRGPILVYVADIFFVTFTFLMFLGVSHTISAAPKSGSAFAKAIGSWLRYPEMFTDYLLGLTLILVWFTVWQLFRLLLPKLWRKIRDGWHDDPGLGVRALINGGSAVALILAGILWADALAQDFIAFCVVAVASLLMYYLPRDEFAEPPAISEMKERLASLSPVNPSVSPAEAIRAERDSR